MKVDLNRIDGIDDAIISMFLSKRTLTPELELEIRQEVARCSNHVPSRDTPIGALTEASPKLRDWLDKLMKWGTRHITMLRFIDLSFSVYGLHRGGQDDWDAHACRFNNRIIRSSTRMANFGQSEMSGFYEDKIVPTDAALAALGIEMPEEVTLGDRTYVRAVNGYILKGHEDDKDYKRGLYMMSIPSDFIFRIQATEFAHVYRERNDDGSAHPEVKEVAESCATQVAGATLGYLDKKTLMEIRQ